MPMRGRSLALGLLWLVLMGVMTAGCAAGTYGRSLQGPFGGRVVDLESGQPIQGAVMVVVWLEIYGVGLAGHRFYDAREAVVDAQGHWQIERLSIPFWKRGVQPPTFHLFAPRYVPHADMVTPTDGRVFIDPTVTQMRQLKTREERLKNLDNYPPSIPAIKMHRMIDAVNKERAALGLKPIERGGLE